MDNEEENNFEGSSSNSIRFEDKAFYHYLIEAYPIWLVGKDEPPDIEQNLENQFFLKNQLVSNENSRLEVELEALQQELSKLESIKSPLQVEEELQKAFEKDMSALEKYKKQCENLISKTGEKIEFLERNNELMAADIKLIDEEISNVEAILNEQKISIVEVGQMNAEKSRLCASLDDNQARLGAKQEEIWQRETGIQKFLDSIEEMEQKYNESVSQIDFSMISDINSISIRNPNKRAYSDIDASAAYIRVNLNANDPSSIVQPPLKPDLENVLGKIRELVLSNNNALSTATFEISEENIKLEDSKLEINDKMVELTKKCERLQKEAESVRQTISEQSKIPSLEIDNLENEIQLLESSISDTEQQAKENYMVSKTGLESVKRTALQFEDNLSKELMDSVDELLKMQSYVQRRLAESTKAIFMD
ncbi:putative kinetochore protein ndc80 [Smittium mucronatum]|uniref:Putative kinetochore protein ndc80 n=1 Tax=Smittium mucronatum TaxID=133383 RepID=A0A1R0H6T2_9FUNG|nr:putative kinetochore protein ndc80 [Smittium mucronatum]